jgi:hypothetical protein
LNQIQAVITRVTQMVPARYSLVVDTSGQVVCSSGENPLPDFSILGSLIAADLAASQEIARLTGDYQDYQMVLREGSRTHIAICEAGNHLAVLVAFPSTSAIGWARKIIHAAIRELGQIAATGTVISASDIQEVGSDELPDLYKDALDQIWKD